MGARRGQQYVGIVRREQENRMGGGGGVVIAAQGALGVRQVKSELGIGRVVFELPGEEGGLGQGVGAQFVFDLPRRRPDEVVPEPGSRRV